MKNDRLNYSLKLKKMLNRFGKAYHHRNDFGTAFYNENNEKDALDLDDLLYDYLDMHGDSIANLLIFINSEN